MASAKTASSPVGYLVNHPDGLWPVYRESDTTTFSDRAASTSSPRAPTLTARVLVAPCEVRGLAPVTEKVALAHGPIPAGLFEWGLRWFRDDPGTERFFAIRWDGDGYRPVVPEQDGTATSLTYTPPAGVVAEFHSHGRSRAFFSKTDDADEQGFRIYGVAGRLDTDRPELKSPGRRLRPLRPGGVVAGLRRATYRACG